jgi:phosphoribosylaminoimidazole carboxylase (NCAIR synthetase)
MLAGTPGRSQLLQNRFLQKKFVSNCGVPTADFRLARNHRELVVAHQAIGFPGVLKLQSADGAAAGPWIVRDFDDVPRVLRQTNGQPLLWERLVVADGVVTIAATRAPDSTVETEPVTGMTVEVERRARDHAASIAERLELPGTYIIKFFRLGDRLLFDELSLVTGAAVRA